MTKKISLDAVFTPSENVVAREIEGEIIIVPLVAGIGDMEDELFTLNDVGKSIWNKFDGKKNIRKIIKELSKEYESSSKEIEKDVIGFIKELLNRKMIVNIRQI